LAVLLPVVLFVVVGDAKEVTVVSIDQDFRDGPYCDPCINRTTYTIKAILHGKIGDPIWEKIVPSARQAAKDMGVNLELELYPYVTKKKLMAESIRAAVAPGTEVDALIVNIPSKDVASAVRYASESGMPVFGLNSGFEFVSGPEGLVEEGSVLFFTATDERLGGEKAASYFVEEFSGVNADGNDATNLFNGSLTQETQVGEKYTHALFISPPRAVSAAYQQQFNGYRDRLLEDSNNAINVEWFEVQEPYEQVLEEKLSNCTYQSVLVGAGRLAPSVADAIGKNGCNQIKFGSFDSVPKMDLLVAEGKIDFVIDQFNHLQGWAAVQYAALYVTTGHVFAPPQGGVYLSGPVFSTKNNFTTGTLYTCTEAAFPVCPNTNGPGGSRSDCECTERKTITIGGVVHGVTTDKFWDIIFSAAEQGAIDMGIELKLDRFEPREDLFVQMASKIHNLCESSIDGLFVTLVDDVVVDAIRNCTKLNPGIQIMSINAGYEQSKELNLIHHVGMLEKDAGFEAGKMMAKMATFDKALCLNHMPWLNVLSERCDGFGQAMNESGIAYLGQVVVNEADTSLYVSAVESAVGESGDWNGYGILLPGLAQLPAALDLKKLHTNVVMGSFDTDSFLHESLLTGGMLFGIDQQPYLQGYSPIAILTNAITTKQTFLDHSMKSGPKFVIAPPTDGEAACRDREFPVCSGD